MAKVIEREDGFVVGGAAATQHRTVEVDGVDIFYREGGDRANPTALLLHGFPTSSFMFRNLIPALADEFHLVAPDYPPTARARSRPRTSSITPSSASTRSS